LSSEQPCEPKSLDVVLNIAEVEKICLKNLLLWSTLEAIQVLDEMTISDKDICVLCGW